ncbi:MAG: AI-2E family transporter [Clostridiales bacterium]|nr:AI-2E family transporter [Clostridiales bacterium]
MKKFKLLLEKQWFAYTFAACCAVTLYLFLSNFSIFSNAFKSFLHLISPIIIGLIFAYLLNPIVSFFEKKVFKKMKKESSRHIMAVTLCAICFLLVLTLLLVALIPSLIKSVTKLVNNWPIYTHKLEELLDKATIFAERFNLSIDLENLSNIIDNSMDKGVDFLKNNSKTIITTVGDVGTSIGNFFIGILFGFCFLVTKKTLIRFVSNIRAAIFKAERRKKNNELLLRCHKIFIRYVGCTLLDALIVGIATLIFLLIIKAPYAPLIALIVAITNIIPTFGPIIGEVMGVFFLVLDRPINALFFLIFAIILQAMDGMIIKPRLFSGSLGIPGVWTLILIILGGKVAGIWGIIFAIPFAAIFVILYHETILPRLKRRAEK